MTHIENALSSGFSLSSTRLYGLVVSLSHFLCSVRRHMQLYAANDVRQLLYQSITFIFKHLAVYFFKKLVQGDYTPTYVKIVTNIYKSINKIHLAFR